MPLPALQPRPARRQRGVVLLISLIILAVLLAAGAALVRSFDTSLFQAGNLAFKRDLANQAERVVTPEVLPLFAAGGALDTVGERADNRPLSHYSATMLPSNAQGIPTVLLNTNPANAGEITDAAQGVRILYLIDRMCMSVGDETTLGDRCIGVDYADAGGSVSGGAVASPRHISYRVSVRVDGPRNTQGFFQTVLSVPSP
jgi:hypothetical protein